MNEEMFNKLKEAILSVNYSRGDVFWLEHDGAELGVVEVQIDETLTRSVSVMLCEI